MKAKAPPPPPAPQPAPRRIFRNAIPDGGGSPGGDTKENILHTMVDLHITLPAGYQTTVTVDGRKALMDLLVDLCGQYHLNPVYHTLELLSPEALPVAFKPNALLGTLDVSCALIKEKVAEERVVRKPPPKVPEQEESVAPKKSRAKKSVRLVVNYHRGQKAVVRVNPLVPLQNLVPIICQKCEFDPAYALLLRDSISNYKLDLHRSLSELDIRELYVLDQSLVLRPKMASAPALNYSAESLRSNTPSTSGIEKKGLLGFFKFNRRKSKTEELNSEGMDELDDSVMHNTDTNEDGLSVVGGPCVEVRPNTLGQSQSAMNLSRMSPKTEPKKRRAPAPPPPPVHTHSAILDSQTKPGSTRSDSQMKKRKAPAPPTTPTSTPEPARTIPAAVVHVPTQALCTTSIPAQVLSSTPLADDSLSDLSHSIEDSEPAGSICSSSSSDVAAESATSSLVEELMAEPTNQRPESSTPELEPEPEPNPQPTPRTTVKQEPSLSTTLEETESALELKMEEMENNRHSAIAWMHSVEQKTEQEVETVSMCSSESLADQGYAASEGMVDDSGLLSSPSDLTQPTSPEDTISLGHEASPTPSHQPKDCSSDSDEGCATWGSRHSEEVRRGNQSDKRQNSFEEDAELTAQIHLTLADLDADLAEIHQSDEASVFMVDEIPVSVVDVDVPVTTIDEVPDEDQSSMSVHEVICSTQSLKKQHVTDSSNKLSVDVCNKNNNARVSDKASVSQTQADQIQYMEKAIESHGIKSEVELEKPSVLHGIVPLRSQSPVVCPVVQSTQTIPESTLRPSPLVCSYSRENPEVTRALSSNAPTVAQIKIAPSPMSRFGLKTFTVIPPKPVVAQTHKPASSLGIGAIKIDELGNMVKQREAKPASTQDKYLRSAEVTNDPDSLLLGKAKVFWSSNEKQDPAPAANKEASVKIREGEVTKPLSVTLISHPPEKPRSEEPVKEPSDSTHHLASTVMNKLSVSDHPGNASQPRKNLFFLKPSRRTSSQYVASAIAKYTGTSSSKVKTVPEAPESTSIASRNFKPEVRPYQKDPHASTNASSNPVPYFAGPKRSQSYPSDFAENQSRSEEPQFIGTRKGSLSFDTVNRKTLDSSPVNSKQQEQTSACTESTRYSFKENTSIKNAPENTPVKSQTNTTRPPIPKKPEIHSPGFLSEPNQVSLFGPVKKFKPVMLKSIEKETSLHSSLMEAIQSGEGTERLRKVSESCLTSTMKKPSFVEADNERSALMSAIRAQSNSSRLKKTESEAAVELKQFRKAEEDRATPFMKAEEDRAAKRDAASPNCSDPPEFAPPPPPPMFPPAPPPPPPSSVSSKPSLALSARGNPELAREALLEAIRSGAGAERLRKVPVTIKTLKVNGRLGIIQAPSSLSQEH